MASVSRAGVAKLTFITANAPGKAGATQDKR
jgi:hypothetical protein